MHHELEFWPIPEAVLAAPVLGCNLLRPGTFADQLGHRRTLLVFLRHFGSSFCADTVCELRDRSATDRDFPPLLFLHQGGVARGLAFFERHWAQARAIADPARRFYRAFGVRRASFTELFGPRVWAESFRALSRGHRFGMPVGDPLLMPGLFVVEGEQVLWEHHFRDAADHPDFADIPLIAAALS